MMESKADENAEEQRRAQEIQKLDEILEAVTAVCDASNAMQRSMGNRRSSSKYWRDFDAHGAAINHFGLVLARQGLHAQPTGAAAQENETPERTPEEGPPVSR